MDSSSDKKQVIARDELLVPTAKKSQLKIQPNVRLETTVKQKEETFQVVIDVIKNSTCIKAFTISADVPEILMQQFWYTITKIKGSESYEFLLADKRCVIDAEVFRKILDICPRKEGEDFTEVQNDEDTLTFLVDLGYSGPLHKYTNMFVDHMHQPWRTLVACINKCLSGKTASNDKLRKSRIDILWGMFYRENVDYPSLIWEDIAYQIDHRREKKSRRENMPYPRFTKVIIDYFLSKHKSLKKLKFQHFHTIKDDGVVSRLKFVRMGEDVQQYGLAIPATMLNKEIIQSESYKRFILYSTGQIPPKKSRGKGSQGKKSANPTEESVDVSDESEPEPLIRRKTSSRRVTKKKATISVDDNIVPEPDIALELGKSISLTEAEEEAAARQVHATHARIVSESVPEPARRRRSDIAISETTQKLKGIQTLTPAEQEAADVMKALKDSRRMLGRQPGTGGSDEGTGEIPGVPDESIFADAEDDNEETESDSDDIYKYRINVRKNADTEMKDAEKTADITKETTEQPLTSSSFSVPSDYGNQFLNLSHNEEIFEQPPKIDHSAVVLASIQSHVPPVVDKYVGTKLDDALLKALERHTADLVEKYSVLPTPESSKKQESKKSPEEIIRIKREQEEKKQEPTYTIKSTDKVALEEFDLKSALFKFMHKNKFANRNPANYRLYHALMEALIEDENDMDKEVADTIKDHKRKHDNDDDDDDDDEGPPVGSNQGKSTKRRRTRESESAKRPSTAKESSKDKDPKVGSKLDIPISDEGHVSDPEDTNNAHMPKVPDTTTWFRPILEEERPASSEPELVIPPIDLPEADNNWANAFTKVQELSKSDLEGPAFMMVKGFHENIISLQFQMEECHKLLTNQIDLVNPEGHRIVPDISNPLPLGGPPGQVTIQPQFFFNKDLEYLLTGEKERHRALSISKLKAALYQDFGLEELVLSLWIENISAAYGITHWWFSRKQFYINKHSEPSDCDAVRSHMRILSVISIKTYERYGYNYLRDIVLRRADYNEYKILKKDFKSLHPNDFVNLNILHIQGKLDHLPKQDKDASDFPFKEDYTIIFKPRAVIYKDRDDNRKMMRINEVHKFSDGTLTRIKGKLDFMVKDFKLFKFNKGIENRKWTEDGKRRNEDFIEVIERRLKIRRIFQSQESFVGGRLRDIDCKLISRTENKTILRVLCIILVILPEHQSKTKVFHNEDGNPARANIKQALGRYESSHKGVKASANSDIVYFFISAQDGDPLQDDVRLCLTDDLKKAQDHNQRQVNDESKDHYPKCIKNAIVVPPVLATYEFELKIELLDFVSNNSFFGLENDDRHSHIRRFHQITQTLRLNQVPDDALKLILFPFSLKGVAETWLENEPPNSITSWDDLVSKFLNRFYPYSKTRELRKEIMNFQQVFSETFTEAWERFKDLLRKSGGNLMMRNTQEALTTIENKARVRTCRNKPQVLSSGGTSTQIDAITALTKQSTPLVPLPETPPLSAPKPKEDRKPNPHQPSIPYPSRLQEEKFQALENPTGRVDHFVYRIDIVDSLCDKFPSEKNSLSGNPTLSSDSMAESPSPFLTPCGDKESGSTTTRSDYSLPDYDAFYFDDDHIKEKSSGGTTTHSDFSLPEYDSFIFDLMIDLPLPDDRSDSHHEEFADELAHIISLPEYDHLYFDFEPNPGELTILFEENLSKNSTNDLIIHELNDFPLLLPACDSIFSEEFSEIDPLVSFPTEKKDKVFDPEIFIIKGVQSHSFHIIPLDYFSTISVISDFLILIDTSVIETFLSFLFRNKYKVFDPGILLINGIFSLTRKSPHILIDNFLIDKCHILSEISLMIDSVSFHPKDN
ncbi:retrovirus-related pol polyprotein from transposon TNT 1-94 [Tanacetum coccineum]